MPTKKRRVPKQQGRTTPRTHSWKDGKTALITGASSGIGYDLGSVFAENGYNLVLIARNKEKLLALANQAQQMFGVSAKVIEKDLAKAGAADEVFRVLQQEGIEVDVLVNNAGHGLLGFFAYTGKQDDLGMIQLNVTAVVHLTKLILPSMMKRGKGKILNVASTAGFRPGPLMSNYAATKAYVLSFSAALAEEVRSSGVTVSVLCPGPTYTGFQERAGMRETPLQKLVYSDSRVVARAGFEGLMAGKMVIIPGLINKLGALFSKAVPLSVSARAARRFYEQALKPIIRKSL